MAIFGKEILVKGYFLLNWTHTFEKRDKYMYYALMYAGIHTCVHECMHVYFYVCICGCLCACLKCKDMIVKALYIYFFSLATSPRY